MKHEVFILGGHRIDQKDGREARGNEEWEKRQNRERDQREDYREKRDKTTI